MAWFGSLQTAAQITFVFFALIATTMSVAAIRVFYNRRKCRNGTERNDLEAVRQEVAQRIREGRRISNWDRFGFRITGSSFYGEPFESRTGSLSEPRSPTDSMSKKSMKSLMSQRFAQGSITRTMISLPMTTDRSSPLNQNPVTEDEMTRFQITRAAPQPRGKRFRASDLDPLKLQPSSPNSDIGTASSTSSSPTSASLEKKAAYWSYEASMEKGRPQDVQAPLRLILPAPLNISHTKSISNPIIRKPLPSYSRPLSHQAQPTVNAASDPSYPSLFLRDERSFIGGKTQDRPSIDRTFSTIEPSSVLLDRSCGVSDSAPRKPPRVLSACGSWGAAIFKEVDNSLAAKSFPTSPPPTPTIGPQQGSTSRRTSTSSSIYSTDLDNDVTSNPQPLPKPLSPRKSRNDPNSGPTPLPLNPQPSSSSSLPPTPTSISSSSQRHRKSLSIHTLSFPSPPLLSPSSRCTLAVPVPSETETARIPSADFSAFYDSYQR